MDFQWLSSSFVNGVAPSPVVKESLEGGHRDLLLADLGLEGRLRYEVRGSNGWLYIVGVIISISYFEAAQAWSVTIDNRSQRGARERCNQELVFDLRMQLLTLVVVNNELCGKSREGGGKTGDAVW
ncbi:hypothetical protein QBC38DRAFT_454701 [Podospora fimiseda]|uniref:Uncharacterized protein n=1 Tax=Podospora fimiseda TaxID=252190 RepID=A0AAN7H035_9PEZI|nr:hypothetical protein QBC38DRAFT_454701 [Podospora fimiseda]